MFTSLKRPCDEGVIRAAPDRHPCSQGLGAWVLAATILGSSMAFIDGTVVNVALPAIQAGLNADVAALQWIVEAYALFLAALVLVGGSLGDRYGRRRIFSSGVVLWCSRRSRGLTSTGEPAMLGTNVQFLVSQERWSQMILMCIQRLIAGGGMSVRLRDSMAPVGSLPTFLQLKH